MRNIEQMLNEYLTIEGLWVEENTLENKEYILKEFLEILTTIGIKDIETLNGIEFLKILNHLKEKGLKPSTIVEYIRQYLKFLRFLRVEKGLKIPYNEIERYIRKPLKKLSLQIEPRKELLTENQLKYLYSFLKREYVKKGKKAFYIFVKLLECTGLRLMEAVNLTPEDFYYDKKNHLWVYVRKGKNGKPRKVPILCERKEDLKEIKEWLEHVKRENLPLWYYETKRPKKVKELNYNKIKSFFTQLNKKLPFRVYPHLFRYMFITKLIDKGLTPDQVATIVGHSDVSTTFKYYKVVKLEDIFRNFEDE